MGSDRQLLDSLLQPRRRLRARSPKALRWVALAGVLAVGYLLTLVDYSRLFPEVVSSVPNDRLLTIRVPDFDELLVDPAPEYVADPGQAPAPSAIPVPSFVEGEIALGQSLTRGLTTRGVPEERLNAPLAALSQVFDFRRSRAGDQFEAELRSDGLVTALRYKTDPVTVYEARHVGDGRYDAQKVTIPVEVQVATLAGTIETSLFEAVTRAGEQEALARRIMEVAQWDVDFNKDTRVQDGFRMIFEKILLEGEFLQYGNILAFEYRGAKVDFAAYYHAEAGSEGHYSADGEPLRRMFLVAPCRYRRISSLFDPERRHPVLGRKMPHMGVDFAADTGTPVMSVADGTVSFVGRRGGAGNLVMVKHDRDYETAYAHLSRFARGIREGDVVRQGQVIGFVGNTGLSTGPHLHFGLKFRGEYVDPMARQFSRGARLEGRQLRDFQRRQSQLRLQLEELPLAEVTRAAPLAEPTPEPSILDGDFLENEF